MPKPRGRVARKSDYEFRPIPVKQGRAFIRKHHYSSSASNTAVLMQGMFRGGQLVGVAQFLPPTMPAAKFVSRRCSGADARRVLSLSRLAVAPSEPQNAASMLIGASLRALRRDGRWDALVTYADEGQGHEGTIYKATNFVACGRSYPKARWVDPKTGRHVARKATTDRTHAELRRLGYERRGTYRKHRFIMPLKKRMTCACE